VLDQAFGRLSPDLAIDLGTCNTRVFVKGRGIGVEVPTVVSVERTGNARRVVALGDEANTAAVWAAGQQRIGAPPAP
jgi:rod shape-determining protein MreB